MKKQLLLVGIVTLGIISGITYLSSAAKQAAPQAMAQLCISVGQNDVPRIKAAYGNGILGLGRDATTQEVQDRLRDDVINNTKAYERGLYTPPPMEMQPASPTPTPTATATP